MLAKSDEFIIGVKRANEKQQRGASHVSPTPNHDHEIPEITAEVARGAFPKGNKVMKIRGELGNLFKDTVFMALYPRLGQPGPISLGDAPAIHGKPDGSRSSRCSTLEVLRQV